MKQGVDRGQGCAPAAKKALAPSQPCGAGGNNGAQGCSSGTSPSQQRMSQALSEHAGETYPLQQGLTGR